MAIGVQRGRDEDRRPQPPSSAKLVPQLQMSQLLVDALESRETFFHYGQQSNKMLRDNHRRTRLSEELKRRSVVGRLLSQGCRESDIPPSDITVDSSNVTVTMQIYYGEYKNLYERRRPDSLWAIMEETNTLIRFPDKEEDGDFASQVSISGRMEDVEKARRRLRGLCHLSITFPVVDNKYGYNLSQINDWIQEQRNDKKFPTETIIVRAVPPQNREYFDKLSINVFGTLSEEPEILEAIRIVCDLLFEPKIADKLKFCMELTVPMSQMDMYIGGEQAQQLCEIAKNTEASLHFLPNPHPKVQFHHFLITGKPGAVVSAFKVMQGLQPVQLCLNIRNEDLSRSFPRGELFKQFDPSCSVHISISPSSLQSVSEIEQDPIVHFLCLTAQEHNIGSCYDMLMKYLRRDNPMVNNIPRVPVPAYMKPILPHIVVTAKHLDINRNQPIPLMFNSCTDSASPSGFDHLESDNFHEGEMRRGYCEIPLASDAYVRPKFQSDVGYYIPRDDRGGKRFGGSGRSSVDGRSESGSYVARPHSRQFYNNSRPFRRNRQNSGDKRNTQFSGNKGGRYNNGFRDREMTMKSELQLKPRGQSTTPVPDRPYSNNGDYQPSSAGFNEYFNRRDGQERPFRGAARQSSETGSGYSNYYSSQGNSWRPNPHEKIYLKKKTPAERVAVADAERSISSPTEMHRRMNAMDLIKCASEQQYSQPVEEFDANNASRTRTYAEILEGNKRCEDHQTDSSQEIEYDSRYHPPARRSYSVTCVPAVSIYNAPPYPSYSPFASVRYLDQRVDVDHVLFSLNCTKYIENFRKANVSDLQTFSLLNDEDLKNLGITSELDRRTILAYAIRLRTSVPPPATVSRSGPSICT